MVIYDIKVMIEVKIYYTFDSSWTIRSFIALYNFSVSIRKHSILSPKFVAGIAFNFPILVN